MTTADIKTGMNIFRTLKEVTFTEEQLNSWVGLYYYMSYNDRSCMHYCNCPKLFMWNGAGFKKSTDVRAILRENRICAYRDGYNYAKVKVMKLRDMLPYLLGEKTIPYGPDNYWTGKIYNYHEEITKKVVC